MPDGVQTHHDIPEIPEGVELPDSSGSLEPDVEEPAPVDYDGVLDEPLEEVDEDGESAE